MELERKEGTTRERVKREWIVDRTSYCFARLQPRDGRQTNKQKTTPEHPVYILPISPPVVLVRVGVLIVLLKSAVVVVWAVNRIRAGYTSEEGEKTQLPHQRESLSSSANPDVSFTEKSPKNEEKKVHFWEKSVCFFLFKKETQKKADNPFRRTRGVIFFGFFSFLRAKFPFWLRRGWAARPHGGGAPFSPAVWALFRLHLNLVRETVAVLPLVLRPASGVHEKIPHRAELEAQLIADGQLHFLVGTLGSLKICCRVRRWMSVRQGGAFWAAASRRRWARDCPGAVGAASPAGIAVGAGPLASLVSRRLWKRK